MRDRFVNRTLRVLDAIAAHRIRHGQSPTVREICLATGILSEIDVWQCIESLLEIGVIKWDKVGNRRPFRGIELLVRTTEPAKIPLVGNDYVPGSRWLEFHDDGVILYVTPDKRDKCEVVVSYE
jgi:SOS-response transcriptional repressor LexA